MLWTKLHNPPLPKKKKSQGREHALLSLLIIILILSKTYSQTYPE